MQNYSKCFKILLTFFTLGFIIWLGGTVIRTTIAYDLFIVGSDFTLKPEYTNAIRIYNTYVYSITALYTGIGYGVAALSSIILFVLARNELKKRGWMFMSLILFTLTIPFEVILIYNDIQLSNAVYYGSVKDFFDAAIQKYYINRLTNVQYTMISGLVLLAAITCMLYAIWRPLDKAESKNDDII